MNDRSLDRADRRRYAVSPTAETRRFLAHRFSRVEMLCKQGIATGEMPSAKMDLSIHCHFEVVVARKCANTTGVILEISSVKGGGHDGC